MASAEVTAAFESDLFSEEERTFDFGEEESTNLGLYDFSVHPSMVKDYGGEDYSKYMNDDDGLGFDETYPSQYELQHFQAHEDNAESAMDDGNYYDTIQDVLPPIQHQSHYDYSQQAQPPQQQQLEIQTQRVSWKSASKSEKLKWLKQHISKATMAGRTRDRRQSTNTASVHDFYPPLRDDNPNKIYNFSFADSKMGYSLAALIQENQQTTMATTTAAETADENADSGIGVDSSGDIPEVINEMPGLQRSSWWSLGTLSSRLMGSPNGTVSSNPPMKRHSASSPFLANSSEVVASTSTNPAKSVPKNSLNKMWKRVTDTLSKKSKRPNMSIKTEEIHF